MKITKEAKIYAVNDAQYAASELAEFLGKTFDSAPLVITADKNEADIIIGEPCINEKMPKDDGFCIECDGKKLYLYGSCNRGTLYAVYGFLEKFADTRWFTPDVTKIVRKDKIYVGEMCKIDEPAFLYREPFFVDAYDPDFAAHLRVVSRKQTGKHGGFFRYVEPHVHTMDVYCPSEKYFDEHPEYFALVDGVRQKEHTQPCLTNPEVLKIVTEAVRERLKADPCANAISISQNDFDMPCECERCKAVDEEEGSSSGTLIRFVNSIAESLEDEFPNVLFDTLAYRYTRTPPRITKPRNNVVVRLCTIESCFMHPLDECNVLGWPFCDMRSSKHTICEDLEGWGKICKNVFIWDYVVNFANYIMPYPNINAIVGNMKLFAGNSVKGVFTQGEYQSLGGDFAPLKVYIISKLMWDPNCDIKTAAEEFIAGVYGNAGKYISEYLQMLHDHVKNGNIHVGIYDMPPKLQMTEEMLFKADKLFEEAEKVADDEISKKYVRLAKLSVKYMHLWNAEQGENTKTLCDEFIKEMDAMGITHISEFPTKEISRKKLESGTGPHRIQSEYWENLSIRI